MILNLSYDTCPAEPTHGKDESIHFKLSCNGSLCPQIIEPVKIFLDWMRHNFVIKDSREDFRYWVAEEYLRRKRNEISAGGSASGLNAR